jgi:hypothetical protein
MLEHIVGRPSDLKGPDDPLVAHPEDYRGHAAVSRLIDDGLACVAGLQERCLNVAAAMRRNFFRAAQELLSSSCLRLHARIQRERPQHFDDVNRVDARLTLAAEAARDLDSLQAGG